MPSGLLRFVFVLILIIGTILGKSDGQSAGGKWCIANDKTPEKELQTALDWACGNGADCGQLQMNQPCYMPNTVKDHASFAFNSYFQKMKKNGGNCDFNGAAVLTTTNPSRGSCKFVALP